MVHLKPLYILVILFLCMAPSTSDAKEQINLKLVCFGDSVTGVYYHTGGRRAYTDMVKIGMENTYPESTITAINAGISGNTTVDALRRIDKDVLAHNPQIVTIMFGLNDMTRVSLDDYRANLITIIEKCQAIKAEVILCTPNSVRDTSSRPTAKLEQYVAVVRDLAKELNLPLADCYATFQEIRENDPLEWAFLMSDEIHPNMDGHKRIAETIIRSESPIDPPAPQPVIPHTLLKIATKKPINILAMEPYDTILPNVFKKVAPDSPVNITAWPVIGKSLSEIETAAKTSARGKGYDLVFLDVPAEAESESSITFIQRYSWILNYSLSFGYQEWDVVTAHPTLISASDGDYITKNQHAARLIRAQDFSMIERQGSETIEETLLLWFSEQLKLTSKK